MRAFARIPNGSIGVTGQGYVPGQSNRVTNATYFDAHGVMRIAPPKALRPNYVYTGGKWVRDGWLREGQAENQDSQFNIPFSKLYHINNEVCVDYMDTCSRTGFTSTLKGKSSQSNPVQFSGGDPSKLNSTFVWCDAFSKLLIDNDGMGVTTLPFIQVGEFTRRYYAIGHFQPHYLNQTENPLKIRVFGPMAEDSPQNGLPTSWVPFGTTRAAD